jgi:hypothetical protein
VKFPVEVRPSAELRDEMTSTRVALDQHALRIGTALFAVAFSVAALAAVVYFGTRKTVAR